MKLELLINGEEVVIDNLVENRSELSFVLNGVSYTFLREELRAPPLCVTDGLTEIFTGGELFLIAHKGMRKKSGHDDHHMVSPMPGKVIKVLVKEGDAVKKGTPLLILEAMKMEHTIKAAADGFVDKIHFDVGTIISGGVTLVDLRD